MTGLFCFMYIKIVKTHIDSRTGKDWAKVSFSTTHIDSRTGKDWAKVSFSTVPG